MTTCKRLNYNYDCESETDRTVTDATSLSDCPFSCSEVARGRYGCCEWQDDWKKCMFVPNVKSEPYRFSSGRNAIDCVSGGLYSTKYLLMILYMLALITNKTYEVITPL